MKFKNIKELMAAQRQNVLASKDSSRIHYPILFKRAVIEFSQRTNTSTSEIAKTMDTNPQNLQRWQDQYNGGLYTLEGSYSVSKKSLSVNTKILKKLNQDLKDITTKIELIKQCEAIGLKIAS